MQEKMQTFDDVHDHVRSLSLPAAPTNREEAMANICPVWKGVKPLLNLILFIPFIPASWKSVITTFSAWMDAICP